MVQQELEHFLKLNGFKLENRGVLVIWYSKGISCQPDDCIAIRFFYLGDEDKPTIVIKKSHNEITIQSIQSIEQLRMFIIALELKS